MSFSFKLDASNKSSRIQYPLNLLLTVIKYYQDF